MTAATSTPASLSIPDSRSDDSAFNLSSTRMNKLSSMFSLLKSSLNISTDSFNNLSTKHVSIIPSLLTQLKIYPHSSVNILRT